jgi:hypothetical protein
MTMHRAGTSAWSGKQGKISRQIKHSIRFRGGTGALEREIRSAAVWMFEPSPDCASSRRLPSVGSLVLLSEILDLRMARAAVYSALQALDCPGPKSEGR